MHPRLPVLDEELPSYESALANLSKDPTPVALPSLKPIRGNDDDLDAEGDEDGNLPD
jgi:hypothetical protein